MTPPTGIHSKRPPRRWRFFLILAVAAAVGWSARLGYRAAKARYLYWKSERAVSQARGYLAGKDLPKAELALQVAFQSGANGDAYNVLADLLESVHSPRSVDARRSALRAEPGNLTAELALATTALRFGEVTAAREALSACSAADKTTPEYRRVAAVFALRANQPALADYLLTELEKEAPGDTGARLLHAAVLLHHPQAEKASAARADLLAMAKNPDLRLPALRVLLDDALERHDSAAAKDLEPQLESAPGATFRDLLAAANAELIYNASHLTDAALAKKIDDEARLSPADAALYVQWLLAQKRTDDAAAWLDALPPTLAANPAVHVFRSEIALVRSDWPGLRRELAAGAWGPMSPAAIQFAFTAQLTLRDHPGLARETWADALAEAKNSNLALKGMARLAEAWRWSDGTRDAFFASVRAFPKETENYPPLLAILRARRESAGMEDAFALWHDAAPDVLTVQYNWALMSLLVNPAALPGAATHKMQELHSQDPSNAYYSVGDALALWELGQVKDACAVLDGLPDAEKQTPARAPYLAVIYASDHRLADAQAALKRAPAAQNLLPEEAALVAKAAALCNG